MAAAAPGAGKDDGVPRRMSWAELVRQWEHVFDNVGDEEEAMELFMTLLLRDARAEHAQQSRTEEQEREEEERRARVFEPWHPPQPGSAPLPPPRVDRSVVLALRAPPPHLLPPRPKQERTTAPPTAPAADLGRPANNARGGM